MPDHILVTGGAGFIGSHTVDLLLQQDYQVTVLDNLSSGKLHNLDLTHPNLEFIEGDVLEFPLILDLLNHCDGVVHLASIASVALSLQSPIYCFQVNMQGLLHVLVAIQQLDRPIALVYASSAAVYGNTTSLPCRDDFPLTSPPPSPYALQKINNEEYAFLYARLYDIKSIGLRYFNVYGERQDPSSVYSGVISLFLEAYRLQKPLTVFGDGTQSRDFIHVRDVARANLLALKSDLSTNVINIATGKAENLLQLIRYLEASGNGKAQIRFEPERSFDIKHSYASVEKAKKLLGFEASIELKDGISMLMG